MEYEKEKQDLIEKYHEEIQKQENKHEREKVIFTFISLHYLSVQVYQGVAAKISVVSVRIIV